MALRDDLLQPVPGDNPGGVDLRYDPIYEKVKEARRQDDEFAQGAWQRERKVADWPLVIRLCSDAIKSKSKDLQLAVWLSEALLQSRSFGGFADGLDACLGLVETLWEHLFPEIDEDGDLGMRVAPLSWLGAMLIVPLKSAPLTRERHSYLQFKESRQVGYEEAVAKNEAAKKARQKEIAAGKLAAEDWDKAFLETPKALYAGAEKALDACLATVTRLGEVCDEKCGDDSPAFNKLKETLTEIRHQVHQFLQKKRETEPDEVEAAPAADVPGEAAETPLTDAPALAVVPTYGGAAAAPALAAVAAVAIPAEPADRALAIGQVVAAAAFLRKREPYSPAPYLMLRGLRWGELRAAAELSDPALLEAPPTELRRQVKQLALAGKWNDVIEAAEAAMAHPCSRAWLDLQRLVVEACAQLGKEYDSIAIAIRSELRALLRDVPQLLTATLMDDTPAANAGTQAWLRELINEPEAATPQTEAKKEQKEVRPEAASNGWQRRYVDPYQLAQDAAKAGQEQRALEILRQEIEKQRHGRGRFLRKLQFVELATRLGKEAICQPIVDDLLALVDAHKLDEWEDREMLAGSLITMLKASKKLQDAKEKAKLFDRICRLDPVQAATI